MSQAKPGHMGLVPSKPRGDTPVISDGEIWDIEVVGSRVFVAGSFTTLSNDGGPVVDQPSLAAYDIDTGLIDMSFRPDFGGGGVNAVEASPDGTALYVAGTFGSVNGIVKQRIARLDMATGAPVAGFTANTGLPAGALAVSNSTVYVGGSFARINDVPRSALAALNRTTGAVDLDFDLPLSGGLGVDGALKVQQLKLTHDDRKLLVVHTGRRIAGVDRYGVGLVDTATKSLLPWRTRLWEDNLAFVGGIQRAYAGDISPDDSYFVVTSGSGGDRPPINDTAVAFSTSGGDNVAPLWVSRHFDSIYSVAITEQAVYVGGHFSWEESPTAPVPWPGLDNVGYGNGQGLSGYGLGDAVVRRDGMGALDPARGTALEWNPGATAYEGVKTLEATPRGLFAGGDGMFQGGVRVGRVGFFDLDGQPAPSPVDTTIVAPIEGRVVTADQPTVVTGRATSPLGATGVEVQLQDRNSKLWLQDDLVTWGAANAIDAAVASPGATSTSWSLRLTLTGSNEYQVLARAVAADGTDDPVKATKKFESFAITDATPETTISSPPSGLVATRSFTVTGSATDDVGVNALVYYFRDGSGQYLQDDGSVASTYNSFRGEPDVIGAPSASWQHEVVLPSEGTWSMGATAVDTAGQSDRGAAVRDWVVSADGQVPTVSIAAPVAMTPPDPAAPLTVRPGAPITFSGTAADEGSLATVEISLRNTTTRESLAADGTWGRDSISAFHRISPRGIGTSTYDWSYTTPFDLTPGVYDFRVRATDSSDLTTASANQGRIALTAQVLDDAFPNGVLDFTGVEQNIEALHLDVTGSATDDRGVAGVRVSLRDLDTGRYLQPNATMAAGFATLDARLGSPGAKSTTFSLPVNLPTQGTFSLEAWAVDSSGQQDTATTGATARYLVYPGDLDPSLSETLSQPTEGASFTESRIVVSGRALDDKGLARVDVAVVNSAGQYMSAAGAFTSTVESYRAAFLNSPGTPGSNYSFTSPVIPAGTYTVKVRAVDNHAQLQQTPKTVTVTVSAPAGNAAPVAAATVACAGFACTFDANGSTDESPTSLTYSWTFGNGLTGVGPVPRHTYAAVGTYSVVLTVRDEYGASSAVTLTVRIAEPADNVAPSAAIGLPDCQVLTCQLSGSGSDPNPGNTLRYSWDFGDGTPVRSGAQVSHSYANSGTYQLRLSVTDDWGRSGVATRQVVVSDPASANQAPVAAFTSSCSALACAFNGSGSSDPDAGDSVASYAWNFGDGSAVGAASQPTHTYAAAGTYQVRLTVTDTGGATGSVVRSVTTTAPPAANIAFRAAAGRSGDLLKPSVTIPTAVVPGDTMIMFLSVNRATAITNPAGWVVLGSRAAPGNLITSRAWSRVARAGDAGRVISLPLAAKSKFSATISSYTGADPVTPVATAASAAETLARPQHTTPAVPGGEPGSRLVSFWSDRTSATTDWRPPVGHPQRSEVIGGGAAHLTSLLTDAPGGGGGVTATANSTTKNAVMWSVLLDPA